MKEKISSLFLNYLNSGWTFEANQNLFKYRFYLLNMMFIIGFIALSQGIIVNIIAGYTTLVYIEIALIIFFLICIYYLRKDKNNYSAITTLIAIIVLLFFNSLILFSKLENIKFIWLFFYIVTFMFLKGNREGLYLIGILFLSLLFSHFQTFIPSYLTFDQTIYLIFVLSIVTLITYFFQAMIDRGYSVILSQNHILQDQLKTIKEQEQMLINQSRFVAMGEMIQMIAHQWRQPLANATLMISNHQIKQMLEDKTEQDDEVLLNDISKTLKYLSGTIDDFQTYFKPDAKIGVANINDVLRQSTEFIGARLKHYSINLSLTCKDDVFAKANTNELVQVLLNLLNNAIDALKDKKNSEKFIHIYVKNDKNKVEIVVEDNAGGVKDENISKLFEPYFSTKGKNGTGLGLYMVKMIVEKQFKGSVNIKNIADGLRFSIVLESSDGIIH
jgi:signal transduction histidine kinase